MTVFIADIPNELIEARIDGANELSVLRRVVFPLSGPGLARLSVISFMFAYNRYLLPLLVVADPTKRPMIMALNFLVGRYGIDLVHVAAAGIIIIVPIIFLFAFTASLFKRGIAMFSRIRG